MTEKAPRVLVAVFVSLLLSVLALSGFVAYKMWRHPKARTKKTSVKMRAKRPELKVTIPQMKSDGLSHSQYPPILRPVSTKFIIPPSPLVLPSTPATPDTPGFIPTPNSASPFDIYDRQSSLCGYDGLTGKRRRDRSPDSLWRTAVIRTGVAQTLLGTGSPRSRVPSISASGKIKFCVKYEEKSRELFIKILEFVDLPLAKETGRSFPYVKVFLYPGSRYTKKSGTFEVHILHFPQETTCYFAGLTMDEVQQSALRIIVLDYDKFSRTEFVAEVYELVADLDMTGQPVSKHLEVKETHTNKAVGSLLLSLCYHPATSEVTVIIMKASGLPCESKDGKATRDYFVKITLLRSGMVADKRRTKVAKKTSSPVFNEKLVFPVDQFGLRDICMVFDVMTYESRRKHSRVGHVAIGNNLPDRPIMPHELQHFNEMLNHPQKQTAEWHSLVDSDAIARSPTSRAAKTPPPQRDA